MGSLFGGGGGSTPKSHNIDKKAFESRTDDQKKKLNEYGEAIATRQEGVDQREFRAGQTDLAKALEDQAYGRSPSIAENQLKTATDRTLAQQLALASSSRGNSAPTARTLLRNQATMNQDLNREGANLRLQEQMQARQQLADVLNQSRSQDIGSQQMTDAAFLQNYGLLSNLNEADRQALIERERMNVAQVAGNNQIMAQNRQTDAQVTGGFLSAAGGAMSMMSDENEKKNIKSGSKSVKEFLDAIDAKSYEYKEPNKHGEGKHLGVMAQELEDAGEVGESMVEDTPEGKVVDFGKGFGAILAAQAELNKRLEKLEKRKRKG